MTVKPIPDGYHSVTPYLAIRDAAKAIDFYQQAFGAEETVRMAGPDGKIGHAEIRIGDSVVMMSDEWPEMGVLSPESVGGPSVAIMIYVDDVDEVFDQAVAAGATSEQAVEDKFFGDRAGSLRDPFGHRWFVHTHVEDVPPEEMAKRAQAAMEAGMT